MSNNSNGKYSTLLQNKQMSLVFWSEHSCEHISFILTLHKNSPADLNSSFENELRKLFSSFKKINYTASKHCGQAALTNLINEFIRLNAKFISLLQRLTTECSCGFPFLLQSVYGYLYEQQYINSFFSTTLLGNVERLVLLSHISAMHPLMLTERVTGTELSAECKEKFACITNQFNSISYKLSECACSNDNINTGEYYQCFLTINAQFIALMTDMKSEYPNIFIANVKSNPGNISSCTFNHIFSEHQLLTQIKYNKTE